MKWKLLIVLAGSLLTTDVMAANVASAPRQMENLGRGLVGVRTGETTVFLSWRLLGTEPDGVSYNVYRQGATGTPEKVNAIPLQTSTCFTDQKATLALATRYFVRALVDGKELEASEPFTFPANAPVRPYLSIPLTLPPAIPPTTPRSATWMAMENTNSF